MADDKQAKGNAALEGFEMLAKSNAGQACVMVIQQVLKHPQIFVFGELLDIQNVKDLVNTPHKPWLELLRLFAYGTYANYKAQPDLPKLDPAQLTKLRQLSIVEYAAKNKELPYSQLMKDLDVLNVRELEDLIIDSVYIGLIQGKLDQRKRTFEVQSVIGRDLGPSDVDNMINTLGSWLNSSDSNLKILEKKIETANTQYEKKKKEKEDIEKTKKDTIEAIKVELQNGNQEVMALVFGGEMGGRGPRPGPGLPGPMDDGRGGSRRRGPQGPAPPREPGPVKNFFRPNKTR